MRSKLLLCLSVLLLFGCTKKNENVESKRQNSINVDDLINAIKKRSTTYGLIGKSFKLMIEQLQKVVRANFWSSFTNIGDN